MSVVDAAEAREALLGGAHVIDAKDPARGALGNLPSAVLRAIVAALPAGTPSSAALGEARDLLSVRGTQRAEAAGDARAAAGAWPVGLSYVKVGLGGYKGEGEAGRALDALRRFWRPTVQGRGGATARGGTAARPAQEAPRPALIVAAYADYERVSSLPPQALPAVAARAGASGCLLDTAVKDGSCLFEWIDERALAGIVAACRARGLLCALAGSLRLEHLARLASLGPDLIGVRGAACGGDRARGRVRAGLVSDLLRAVQAAPAA